MDNPVYSLSDVAAAIGLRVGTLRMYVQRGHFVLRTPDLAARGGVANLVTLRRALQWGVAVRLIKCGYSPKSAERAAFKFSDCESYDRRAGELFALPALTVLMVDPDACDFPETGSYTRVVRRDAAAHFISARRCGLFIIVNDVVACVSSRLLRDGR